MEFVWIEIAQSQKLLNEILDLELELNALITIKSEYRIETELAFEPVKCSVLSNSFARSALCSRIRILMMDSADVSSSPGNDRPASSLSRFERRIIDWLDVDNFLDPATSAFESAQPHCSKSGSRQLQQPMKIASNDHRQQNPRELIKLKKIARDALIDEKLNLIAQIKKVTTSLDDEIKARWKTEEIITINDSNGERGIPSMMSLVSLTGKLKACHSPMLKLIQVELDQKAHRQELEAILRKTILHKPGHVALTNTNPSTIALTGKGNEDSIDAMLLEFKELDVPFIYKQSNHMDSAFCSTPPTPTLIPKLPIPPPRAQSLPNSPSEIVDVDSALTIQKLKTKAFMVPKEPEVPPNTRFIDSLQQFRSRRILMQKPKELVTL